MTNLIFNQDKAHELFNSNEQFPVSFDDAWQWLEYERKDNAKRYLLENLEEGIDFLKKVQLGSLAVPRPSEQISLSIEGFKNWAMMSKTEVGKQVRKYFIECERIAKSISSKPKTALELAKEQAVMAAQQVELLEEIERQQLALEAAQPAIEFTKAIEASSNTVSMGGMAKMLGIGRTTFFGKLRQMKVIQQNDTLPYQQHLDSGYFEVTENTAGYPCARVTGTGQIWLQKKFATFEANLAKKEVAIEAIEQVWDCIPLK